MLPDNSRNATAELQTSRCDSRGPRPVFPNAEPSIHPSLAAPDASPSAGGASWDAIVEPANAEEMLQRAFPLIRIGPGSWLFGSGN